MRESCLLLGFLGLLGCNGQVGAAPQDAPKALAATDEVVGAERSALLYAEAVIIEPHDAYAPTCTGVLIAPRVVVTAAHCVVFVPTRTWTVTAPFAEGGAEVHTARDGEPMDAAFRNATPEDYALRDLRDVGVLYLDVPFRAEVATLAPTGFPVEKDAAPTYVSAVGRSTAGVTAGLALSGTSTLDSPALVSRTALDYATARVTAPGESGGPLFVEGTHRLVAVHAHVTEETQTDAWARLDGDVYTWLTQKVASHGGWNAGDPR